VGVGVGVGVGCGLAWATGESAKQARTIAVSAGLIMFRKPPTWDRMRLAFPSSLLLLFGTLLAHAQISTRSHGRPNHHDWRHYFLS
jgi:hypothetical protein